MGVGPQDYYGELSNALLASEYEQFVFCGYLEQYSMCSAGQSHHIK